MNCVCDLSQNSRTLVLEGDVLSGGDSCREHSSLCVGFSWISCWIVAMMDLTSGSPWRLWPSPLTIALSMDSVTCSFRRRSNDLQITKMILYSVFIPASNLVGCIRCRILSWKPLFTDVLPLPSISPSRGTVASWGHLLVPPPAAILFWGITPQKLSLLCSHYRFLSFSASSVRYYSTTYLSIDQHSPHALEPDRSSWFAPSMNTIVFHSVSLFDPIREHVVGLSTWFVSHAPVTFFEALANRSPVHHATYEAVRWLAKRHAGRAVQCTLFLAVG